MLEIIDLAKRYGNVVALDGATFTARPGRIVGFLGPNGAGKTTTMRCIFGLARADRGEVRWAGRPVDRVTRLRFGYMPEQRGLYPRMRVGEQLSYFGQQHGLSGKAADAAARRWLERLGLADREKSKLEELSHGNQQRIQLATALVHDPELLVLDEPFSGLDPLGTATMTEVVRERAAAGVGVLFSSHQLDLVEDVCEDVVIIARGRIVASGPIDELKAASGRRHLDIEVAGTDGAWIGSRPDVQVLEHSGGRMKLLVDDRVPLDELLAAARTAGELRQFSYQPPRLSELFMEAVADAGGDGVGPDARVEPRSRWRRLDEPRPQHLARRPPRAVRARPQPRLHLLGPVHDDDHHRLVRGAGRDHRRRGTDPGRGRRTGARRTRRGDPDDRRPARPGRGDRHVPDRAAGDAGARRRAGRRPRGRSGRPVERGRGRVPQGGRPHDPGRRLERGCGAPRERGPRSRPASTRRRWPPRRRHRRSARSNRPRRAPRPSS